MEQYIDIKYLNNLINLGFSDVNSYPNIKLKEKKKIDELMISRDYNNEKISMINYCKNEDNSLKEIGKIKQIENIKNKIFILLDIFLISTNLNSESLIYKNTLLISYDFKTESINVKTFEDQKYDDFIKIQIIEDEIYSIVGSKIICFENKNLEIIREWEIGEKLYNFCIFEKSQILKMNLDIFFINFQNELKFFGKCVLFDIKQKTLYKEHNIVDKVLFHDGLLMWSSNFTIKIFDLKYKQMILRKNYDDVREEIYKQNLIDFDNLYNEKHSYKDFLGIHSIIILNIFL